MKELNRIQAEVIKIAHKSLTINKKALLYMATGTGKTEIAIKLIQARGYRRVLWLTHQDELAKQSFERFNSRGIRDVTLYTGKFKDRNGSIVIASVQTISKYNNLKTFKPNTFDVIVVDEAHHSPAPSWDKTISFFKAERIALTATPFRPDNRHDRVFDHFGTPVCEWTFDKAVSKKILAKPNAYLILTNTTIEGFTRFDKDLTKNQLDRLYTSEDRNRIIVKSYKEIAKREVKRLKMKPKTICFCINVSHAKYMSKMFNNTGIKAAFVVGDSKYQTPEQRENVMTTFRTTDEIEVICAVNIFNEGVDIPEANIALMLRPTSSNIIYQQQVGRLARTNNGKKKEFIILDFVDNTSKSYTGYVAGNLLNGGSTHTKIITKYLNYPDDILTKRRIKDVMARVKDFENGLWDLYLKDKNAVTAQIEALKKGKVIVSSRRLK